MGHCKIGPLPNRPERDGGVDPAFTEGELFVRPLCSCIKVLMKYNEVKSKLRYLWLRIDGQERKTGRKV